MFWTMAFEAVILSERSKCERWEEAGVRSCRSADSNANVTSPVSQNQGFSKGARGP